MNHPEGLFRYAGGKRDLADEIQRRFPVSFGDYYEPFVGSGAVYFATRPSGATLADANERLIRTLTAIRDEVDRVIDVLLELENTEDCFYRTRNVSRCPNFDGMFADSEIAAWLMFLMTTCYNGLHRVNGDGAYNTPFGKLRKAKICNAEHLRACSAALQGTTIVCSDFQPIMQLAKAGDLVYADPPYIGGFTGYTAGGFGMSDQTRLRDVASRLAKHDVRVLISNSDTVATRALYRSPEFHIQAVTATRSIAARASSRGAVRELLISNYPPKLYRGVSSSGNVPAARRVPGVPGHPATRHLLR